jgi:serine protease inhibitor
MSSNIFVKFLLFGQKSFGNFQLNEEGTEAAAATAIRMVRCASAAIRPPKPKFIADHPFAFLLSNQINHQALFNGTFYG